MNYDNYKIISNIESINKKKNTNIYENYQLVKYNN